MGSQNYYKYILSIRGNPKGGIRKWEDDFYEVFRFWLEQFSTIGRYQFLSVQEVYNTFPDIHSHEEAYRCPYVDEVVGFINWEWWQGAVHSPKHDIIQGDIENMVLEWLSYANGTLFRTDNHEHYNFIKKLSYPLADINKTHGFEQGEVFLQNVNESYFEDLKAMVLSQLENQGIVGSFDPMRSTGRNELYISEKIPEKLLEGQHLNFWGFDIRFIDDPKWKDFLNTTIS